jgi:hypothetical protein
MGKAARQLAGLQAVLEGIAVGGLAATPAKEEGRRKDIQHGR